VDDGKQLNHMMMPCNHAAAGLPVAMRGTHPHEFEPHVLFT
jgi:hypothetical protein